MELDRFEKNGITYFELYISCPVCLDRGNQTPQTYWVHGDNNCNGKLYVGDNGYIVCQKCEANSIVYNWIVDCPGHNKQCLHPSLLISASKYCKNIELARLAGSSVYNTGIKWLQNYLEALRKEF